MFVDRAIITVKAGDGGDGCVAFRREKYIPKGGPNGGNGGRGGSVYIVAEEGMSTLYDFRHRALWSAEPGGPGQGMQCSGADGRDLEIRLPPGTLIIDDATGETIHDLRPGERVMVARGGRGGFGNEHFKSATNQAPRVAEKGEPGQERTIRLELKLIADVGIIGLPNAGKSTLLAALTRAHPKIADYPFTTLSPQLGIAELDASRRVVIADIPGLIEGASEGVGLGHDFLRHVERTRVLVHLIDACPPEGTPPAAAYGVIRRELENYSPALAEKPELIVLSKLDLLPDDAARRAVQAELSRALELGPGQALSISAASRAGLGALLERVWAVLHPRGRQEAGWKEPLERH